jgi:hypothetical protein
MKNIFSKDDVIYNLSSLAETVENCGDYFNHIKDSIIYIMDLMTKVEVSTKANGVDEELELEIKSFFAESKNAIDIFIQMNSSFDNISQLSSNVEKMCQDKMKGNMVTTIKNNEGLENNNYSNNDNNEIPF